MPQNHQNDNELRYKVENNIYPPRFKLEVLAKEDSFFLKTRYLDFSIAEEGQELVKRTVSIPQKSKCFQ